MLVESQCKEDWKISIIMSGDASLIFVSMQRGLKVYVGKLLYQLLRIVSMQRGLKVLGRYAGWKLVVGLNAKRIESSGLGGTDGHVLSVSQCKEDWKKIKTFTLKEKNFVSMQRGLKGYPVPSILSYIPEVSMQRGLKDKCWPSLLTQFHSESQCKEDWKVNHRIIRATKK